MAEVIITGEAGVQMDDLPLRIHVRVNEIIQRLGDWPQVSGAKPLRGKLKGHWRIRTGAWRVVFRPEGERIIIWRIDNRRDVDED